MSKPRADVKPATSGYINRGRHSNPAPSDQDSDSDFTPGVYIYDAPKKSKKYRKSNSEEPSHSGTRKRRRETLNELTESRPKKKRADNWKAGPSHNALLECFKDMDLKSASEGDDEEAEGDSEGSHGSMAESPTKHPELRSFTALRNNTSRNSLPPPQDDSVTEPESDNDEMTNVALSPTSRGKLSTRQRAGSVNNSDDSVTEPESDDNLNMTSTAGPAIASADGIHRETLAHNINYTKNGRPPDVTRPTGLSTLVDSDSVTESETESESGNESGSEYQSASNALQPRPAFTPESSQNLRGPMKLDEHHQVPASINTFLRDYQRDGISFFWERYRQGQGGLLGDDMGLGKTIQVISFLSAIMKKRGNVRDVDRRRNHVSHLQDVSTRWKERRRLPYPNKTWPTCLIIAPSSVVGNWEREFETWGYFEVGIYTGAARAEVLNDFKLGRLDVVITSFETARMDISLLDDLAWSVVIIDEVHRVKNPKSRTTTALARFSCKVRFGLTGTAIQNDYGELWTMLDWANPGSVGTKRQWEGYVVRPLTLGQSKSATDEQHVKAALVAKILTEKLLPKFFLRRTKQIIKDQLPKKIDQVVFCPLTSVQLAVYKRILGLPAVENLTRKDELCDCGSRKARRKCCHPFDKADLFKYMSTLIKIANHLALILPAPNDTEEQVIRNRELSRLAFPQSEIPKYITSIYNPKLCGKWKVLEALLKDWRKDPSNKVLIFTKSVKLLQMLDFHLRNQNLGFVTLDGSTKSAERMPLIDRFHADPDIFVFLISTLAGGTGLNLTGANKVVIFDPNWNPAHDLQAMDRAYRFGQTRDVSVYRLLGAGSIEELIYARQIYKQQQMLVGYNASFQTRYFEGVQGEKSKQGELFGIKNIFKLHEDTLATKKAIEEASILDLDWALSNMDAKGKKASRERSSKTEWVYEAEASGSNEYGDLRGLGALLFDDEAPLVDSRDSGIQKTLNDIGVKYSHRNEDVTAESTIEGQRVRQKMEEQKKAQKKKVRAKKDSGSVHASPEAEWPPRRKHHKAPPSPKTKLRSRQMALVELGMIRSPAHLAEFAQEFGRKTPAEQADILAKADRHAKACTG